ncbi:MAG: cation:proton antiporter [Nitrospirota bacterium]|jgi:Kef-type K+ transport system membrane component KefB
MGKDLMAMAVIIGSAALMPFLSRRLRMPSAAAEIVLGILIFSFLLDERPSWFGFLKETGLIYLMFVVGMELDIRALARQGRFFWYIVLPAAAFIVVPFVFHRLGYPFYLGIVVSVMSAGIVIPVLKELDIIKTPAGGEAAGLSLTGEIVSIGALAGIDIYMRHGITLMALYSVLKIVLLFTAAVLFLKFLYLVAWWTPERVEKVMESEDPVEEGIRTVLFIAFCGAFLAYGAGLEPILGSFVAGMIFSHVFKSKGIFEDKINALGFGFFIPFFFIGVGADFHPGTLKSPDAVALAALLSVMVLASRLPQFAMMIIGKRGLGEAASITVLISAPISMMVVAGTIGLREGLLSKGLFDAVILASLATSIVYPALFRYLGKRTLIEKEERREGAAPQKTSPTSSTSS